MDKRHSILIVDDEPDYLASMRRALMREAYDVYTALSGHDALELLANQDISLVLSDYRMPGMDGLTLLQTISVQYPHIVTVMLTALSEIEIALKAVNEAGVFKFFLKPININSFKISLRSALESLDMMFDRGQMIRKVKSRDTIMQALEKKYPGITNVALDLDDDW